MPSDCQSHHRLAIAVGVSSVVILVVLEILSVLIRSATCSDGWCSEDRGIPTVYLRPPKPESVPDFTLPDREILPAPAVRQEIANPRFVDRAGNEQATELDEGMDPPSSLAPGKDWYAVAKDTAERTMADRF